MPMLHIYFLRGGLLDCALPSHELDESSFGLDGCSSVFCNIFKYLRSSFGPYFALVIWEGRKDRYGSLHETIGMGTI